MENEIQQPENALNNLNLKVSNISNFNPTIYVDGKVIKFRRDNFGNYVTTYQTSSPTVKIEIKKMYDINGPFWFLTSLLFFFVSIFGIFDLKPNKRCISVIASFNVKVTKNCNLKIGFKSRTQMEKAFELEPTECEIEGETGNKYFIDDVAKKRYKTMRIVKIFCWLALIAVIVLLIVNKISNTTI